MIYKQVNGPTVNVCDLRDGSKISSRSFYIIVDIS